jgi:hypothetical protein
MSHSSPSEACKWAGLDSLAELCRITGKNEMTLIRWYNSKENHKAFLCLALGAAQFKNGKI